MEKRNMFDDEGGNIFTNFVLLIDYQNKPEEGAGAGAGEEEEFKGADFDKIPLEKQFVPSLYEDENFDFKVVKPQLHGSHIVYHVQGVDK